MALDIENIKAKLHTKDLEIDLLNTEVKTAFETITALQQRVDDLEQKLCPNSREQPQAPNNNPLPPHCLLLGDINLRRVLRSDLDENCSVRTIHGSNFDLLRSWISEKLNWTPTECVIYSGIHDIIDESPSENILDNLGSLISDLKDKNYEMNIYVCQVVPPTTVQQFKDQIETYNEHLLKRGESNGISIIKTPPHFRLSTGEQDDMCFDGDDNSAFVAASSRLNCIYWL
ncbi:hypothetical protein Pcinc_006265 [Petrolisthes cinctipes]|uniref:Uncharacterized protein n=1 Tax=Petrolisthes cinctipes TaxID=88211 RepID=A0AAE1GDE3_PETCI|nr:hypothetical protein Pcinc_006265 [Petrolisthes cinctipes]